MNLTTIAGKEEYLGIEIDHNRESTLNNFSLETLKDRYFLKDETNAQQAFARASVYGATYKGTTDYNLSNVFE